MKPGVSIISFRKLLESSALMGNMAATSNKMTMPTAGNAHPGRNEQVQVSPKHFVNSNPTVPPFPDNMKLAMFGLGCFWGAERLFWQKSGVFSTQVGYCGGQTSNASYKEVCSGQTGHAEVVRVVYDPSAVAYTDLLTLFWESHNPTQGMRQGNDHGSQYRSAIYYYDDGQKVAAQTTRDEYQKALTERSVSDAITTEIAPAGEFFYAEDYHQQYLAKNPGGYCGLKGTGVACPRPAKNSNKDSEKTKSEL